MILILTTLHKKEMAHKLGHRLLEKRLIVCYNLMPIESAYWWKGKLTEENEVLMILKTKEQNFGAIENYIKENSGYEIPEIVAVKPEKVNQPYLSWLEKETK